MRDNILNTVKKQNDKDLAKSQVWATIFLRLITRAVPSDKGSNTAEYARWAASLADEAMKQIKKREAVHHHLAQIDLDKV